MKEQSNKIIDIQEMLFKEMKRLDDDKMINFTNNKASQLEFARATQLYNMSTGFVKSLNANITIMNQAKRNGQKYEDLMKDKFNIDIENKKLAQYCIKMKIQYKYEKPKKSHSNTPTKNGTLAIKTDGEYIKVKTDKHKWEYLQRLIYENYYNVKLPKDVYVIFLDQDRRNFDIKNLKAITRRSSAIMSKDNLFSTEPRITKLGHLNSKLKIKTKEEQNELYMQ